MLTKSVEYVCQETCLAARPSLPFSLLRDRLHERLKKMGITVLHTHEEVSANLCPELRHI